MGLKPLPIEAPAKQPAKKRRSTSKAHKKMRTRVKATDHQADEKVLKEAASQILDYLETGKKRTMKQITELQHVLHRSVLALQKKRRTDVKKKKK